MLRFGGMPAFKISLLCAHTTVWAEKTDRGKGWHCPGRLGFVRAGVSPAAMPAHEQHPE